MPDLNSEFLCVLEPDEKDWEQGLQWLDENEERRLLFVNAEKEIRHPRAASMAIDSPIQVEPLAKKTAWEAVFMKMKVMGGRGEFCLLFKKELERFHRAANLLLSDAADWGCGVARHAFLRGQRLVRQGMKLAGAFQKVPAIIVGAGPSLAKNGHFLAALRDRALILAGGAALNGIQAEPHFAASIDKEAPYREFKRHPFFETPFCFQSRMNPENLSLVHGEALLFPDSHFRFLGEGDPFEGGWTVGTFLTAIATLMGCDPIVFVGMDFCYEGERKYARGVGSGDPCLVETQTQDGRQVRTQNDWLMARDWMEEWARTHSGHTFINATEGGLGFSLPIREARLREIPFVLREDLRKAAHEAVMGLPFAEPFDWQRWRKELCRCSEKVNAALFGKEEEWEGESVYESLLLPLWQLWQPVFNRALSSDPEPNKMEINQLLFFQRVIQGHLDATLLS